MFKNFVDKKNYQEKIENLVEKVNNADAILIGAAAGMSASCGYNYFYCNDKYFQKYFGEFHRKYGFTGAFNGYYYHFPTSEAKWAFRARFGVLQYESEAKQPYLDLMEIVKEKPFHVLTTNQDFLFTHVITDDKLSQIQGDFRYYQCKNRCHDGLYYNKDMIYKMNDAIDENLEIPSDLIPRCPKCGSELEPWVRGYEFLEGERYHYEYQKCRDFIDRFKDKKLLFLELGVGRMTPMFIKEPFWNLTYSLPNAYYVTINPNDALLPNQLKNKGTTIDEDIAKVLSDTVKQMKEDIKNNDRI